MSSLAGNGGCVSPPAVPPDVDTAPVDTIAISGEGTQLNCSVAGYPPPTITWLQNGAVVNSSRAQLHSNGSLCISPVLLEDMGMYECMAENSEGMVTSDAALLTVHGENVCGHLQHAS